MRWGEIRVYCTLQARAYLRLLARHILQHLQCTNNRGRGNNEKGTHTSRQTHTQRRSNYRVSFHPHGHESTTTTRTLANLLTIPRPWSPSRIISS